MTAISETVAIVTGASSGIGEAVARLILARGGRVIAVALERTSFGADLDARTHWIELDLGRAEAIAPAFEGLPQQFSAVTALINCAGHDAGGRVRFDKMDIANIASIVAVNLTGMMVVTRVVLPALLERGDGHIINIGSISAKGAIATIAAYSASKHGVHGFTAALRADLVGTGIRVSEVVPGKTRTNFATARLGDSAKGEAYYDDSPLGCLTSAEVAASVLWILEQPPGVMLSEAVILPVPARQGGAETS